MTPKEEFKEKLKELGKIFLASLAVMLIVLVPVGISLCLYYLSGLIDNEFLELGSFISGSVCGSVLMFIFLMFLLINKKLRFEENAENTEQEN